MTKIKKCLCKTPAISGMHSLLYCGPRFRYQNETYDTFKIVDMEKDLRVAVCDVQAYAQIICDALNQRENDNDER